MATWIGIIIVVFIIFKLFAGASSGADSDGETSQCKHCGKAFDVSNSEAYEMSKEYYTCDFCYSNGKRDSDEY